MVAAPLARSTSHLRVLILDDAGTTRLAWNQTASLGAGIG